jgi:hypothetical protein
MNFTLEKENVNTVSGTKTNIIDEDNNDQEVGEVLLERTAKARTGRSSCTAESKHGRVALTPKP